MKISTGAIITKNNKYLLLKRDNKKSIYFLGLVSPEGGLQETPIEIRREKQGQI